MDDELDKKMREAFEKSSEAGELPRGVKTFDDFLDYIDRLRDADKMAMGGQVGKPLGPGGAKKKKKKKKGKK